MSNHQSSSALKKKYGKHILAIIPRGEVIRNFVYSECFDQIAEKAKLSLLAVKPSVEMTEMLQQKYGDVYALGEFDERWLVRFEREILDVAHGRWLWSKAAQERWRIRDREARSSRQKIIRKAKKIISYPFSNRTGLKVLSSLERFSSQLLRTTDEYLDLYRRIKPTLVFNGSHIHSKIATQAVQAAQWLKIPTATFIFSWDNLTSQGRITLPYDYYLVWNESLRAQLLEMYEWIKPEQIFVTGTPQFDFHFQEKFYWSKEEFCRQTGAAPDQPIVFYSTGMANHMPNEPEIVEDLANMLRDLNLASAPQLLVRVYPKDLTGRFDELQKRRKDILFLKAEWEPFWLTPKYEDTYMLVNALRHSNVGINIASTVSLELCMYDKPVINVGYDAQKTNNLAISHARFYDFDHYNPVVKSGAVDVAWNREEMKQLLKASLSNSAAKSDQRRSFLSSMFGATLDGNSGSRVARALLDMAVESAY